MRGLNAAGLRRARVGPDDLRALDTLAREALRDPASEAAFVHRYSSTRADLRQFRTAQYLQDLVEMFRPTPALDRIGVPVLAILSTAATFAQPEAMQALLKQMPRVEVQGVECHHWPLTEKPAEVRTAIEAWCNRQSGGAPII